MNFEAIDRIDSILDSDVVKIIWLEISEVQFSN